MDRTESPFGEENTSPIATGVLDKVKPYLPDMSNLYVQPLNAWSDMTLSDRVGIIFQSARPWGDFFDISSFNIPPVEHARSRLGRNVEKYLYNYFLLACVHLFFFSLVHIGSVIAAMCWLMLMYLMYIRNPGDIDAAGKFTIDSNVKMALAVVCGLVALIFGHVFTLLFSMSMFLVIVVGIHGIIRDDSYDNVIEAL